MRKSYGVLAVLSALWASYCFSEPFNYGTTDPITSSSWFIQDYLPESPSIGINAVLYRYTTVKETNDDMLVHVQNKNALGSGYIFRETDDWSGLPSATINKLVPVDNIPSSYFGEGSIEVEGKGSVTSQSVKYNYRIDTAFVTQVPKIDIPEVKVYTYTLDESFLPDSKNNSVYTEESENNKKSDKENSKKDALRRAKKATSIGNTAAQKAMLEALMTASLTPYYGVTIEGGVYNDTLSIEDKKLPENKKALRIGLGQQVLHTKMVNMQYR
jgi:hypothetical protein